MPAAKGTVPWNAGTSNGWTDKRGYRWLYINEIGRRVARREHRVVVERHLGRKLEPWELVHHKDGNKANNDISNLEVTDFASHTAGHHVGGRKSEDARRSMEAFALMREELKREREVKAELLEAARDAEWALEGLVLEENLGDECPRDYGFELCGAACCEHSGCAVERLARVRAAIAKATAA